MKEKIAEHVAYVVIYLLTFGVFLGLGHLFASDFAGKPIEWATFLLLTCIAVEVLTADDSFI